ncbi:reverse transcriptase domain-containing protein [Neobacillus sp.]|uniref:reverse transcriptase domain-containing protein n=1 Tax=Neobacillus sp. TaxID=2675273 RepID=UPI00289BF028|nr:reverse transcriptase domain-containing protein [Neobacillus sp.]
MFEQQLSKELLEFYFKKSYHHLNTGMDKITRPHFETIRDNEYEIIRRKVTKKKYKFTKLKSIKLKNNRIVYIPTIRDRLVLDYLKDKLNTKYRIKYKDRNSIIKSIKNKLSYQMDFYIIRIDIKKFFPSISQNKLLYKLKRSSIISSTDYYLIKEFIKVVDMGVPQGVSISNPLSEIFLEELDFEIKRVDQRVNFYCRYVDDILIVFNGQFYQREKDELKKKIVSIIESYDLTINKEKLAETPISQSNYIEFEYLGYKFSKTKNKLITSITQKKLDTYLGKINKCFNEFIKEKRCNNIENVNLLIERLNFLTNIQFLIKKDNFINKKTLVEYYKIKKIYSGFFYSYKYIDKREFENLSREIDIYIHNKIYSISKLVTNRESKKVLYSISINRNKQSNSVIPYCRFTRSEFIRRITFINNNTYQSQLRLMDFNELEKHYFTLLNISDL